VALPRRTVGTSYISLIFVSTLIWRPDEETISSQNAQTKKPWWVDGTFHDTPPTETKNMERQ